MRSILALGALLAIVASAGNGAALFATLDQVGTAADGAAEGTIWPAYAAAGSPAEEELQMGLSTASETTNNQFFVVNTLARVAAQRTEMASAVAEEALTEAAFVAQPGLAWALTAMDYERGLVLCLEHEDAAVAAECAGAVTQGWLDTLVQA